MDAEGKSQPMYDETQTTAILKRASELQGVTGAPREVGLTLEELRQVARESGIDPRWIDQAASELSGKGRPTSRDAIWGGPLKVTENRILPGSVSEETWEDMVAAVRRSFGEVGTVNSWGRSLEWTAGGKGTMQANVTVTRRAEGTSLSVYWNEGILLAPFVVLPMVGSVISLGLVFEASGLGGFQALALYLSIVATLLLTSRFILSRISRKKRTEVRRLVAELETIVENAQRAREDLDTERPITPEERGLLGAAGEEGERIKAPSQTDYEEREEDAPSHRGRVRSG